MSFARKLNIEWVSKMEMVFISSTVLEILSYFESKLSSDVAQS